MWKKPRPEDTPATMNTFIRAVEYWLPSRDGSILEFGAGIYGSSRQFEAISRNLCFGRGEGLPGQAHMSQQRRQESQQDRAEHGAGKGAHAAQHHHEQEGDAPQQGEVRRADPELGMEKERAGAARQVGPNRRSHFAILPFTAAGRNRLALCLGCSPSFTPAPPV